MKETLLYLLLNNFAPGTNSKVYGKNITCTADDDIGQWQQKKGGEGFRRGRFLMLKVIAPDLICRTTLI